MLHILLTKILFLIQEETLEEIASNVEQTNQEKAPSRHIQDYDVLELLGSGAFGSVYKVKKTTAGQSGNFQAMKEVRKLYCYSCDLSNTIMKYPTDVILFDVPVLIHI